jgi:carboxynorspermidine decarboxylase
MALNSMSQLERFGGTVGQTSIGLRINPGLSFVKDDRFNPCRAGSKLGVPMRDLVRATTEHPGLLADLEGIHFHSNCDAKSFEPLLKTVRRVAKNLDHVLRRVSWVNLGGGYLFTSKSDVEPLRAAISLLAEHYDVDVFIEPGASVVRGAGCLVSSVIDLARIDGETLAFLDTTVNHMPEVYEYQYEPDVVGDARKRRHHYKGKHHYRLVGSTCLAGDTFGQYAFDAPLEIGSRVVFPDMGAYTLAKAHMFNGINLPTIYSVTEEHELIVRKRFSYRDFLESCGGTTDVCL